MINTRRKEKRPLPVSSFMVRPFSPHAYPGHCPDQGDKFKEKEDRCNTQVGSQCLRNTFLPDRFLYVAIRGACTPEII